MVWRDGALVQPRPAEWPADRVWPFADDGGQLWIGAQGKMIADVYGQDPQLLDADRMRQITERPFDVRYPRLQKVYQEFADAVVAGRQTGSDFANHATGLTEMVLLGCVAQRLGAGVDLDSEHQRHAQGSVRATRTESGLVRRVDGVLEI